MNYAGKFGSGELDSHSAASVDIDSLSHRGDADTVTIPDAHLLFSGDFQRSGADLIVSDHDHRVVVPNYFQGDKRPTLVSSDGAQLDAKVIEALTGHVQYAQAAGNAAAAAVKVVGHIVKMTGSASVVRNGVTVTLNEGDNVLQNDVVQTGSGSTLGLVMIDGTTFNLSAGARLMLNDLTYDANSTSNTSLFTLVQGAASFVAGQVAKTGDMKVGTPVATMGIRGTMVVLGIADDGKVSISVVDQRDGQVHAVQVFNTSGVLIGTVTSNGTALTLTPIANFEVIAQQSNKTPAQIAQEWLYFNDALRIYEIQKAIDPGLPQHTENNNANPQQTQTAALGSPPPSPVDTPVAHFNAPVGATIDSRTSEGGKQNFVVNPPPDTTTPASTKQTDSDQIQKVVTVQTAQLPFVVNPTTVPQISSGAGDHFGPVMSASGDVVYDPDGIIYFYDRETGTTIRVTPEGDGFSYGGQTVSSDGRYIAYQGTNGTDTFVFIYGTDPSDAAHYHQQSQLVAGTSPAISGDGSTILVEHDGTIGIHNLQGDLLGTITAAAAGVSGTVWKPAISADGHVVAFWSSDGAAAGGAGHLFTYDLSTGSVTEIAGTATGAGTSAASFSADGRYVVYQSDAPGGHAEIYLYDRSAGQVIFHTENAAGASYNPVISPDGHYIVFASDAHLTSDDGNTFADTYTVDVTNPAHPLYTLVSMRPDGTPGDADSNRGAAISAGGKFVVFATNASNFSNDPDNGEGDIFISDPTSGRSAIIYQTATSPSTLHAEGVIPLTGASSDRTGITLSVVDALGNPTSLMSADFNLNGDIVWSFNEPKTAGDIASLSYGQDFSQRFFIRQSAGGATTDTPVTITVHNGVQPGVAVVDVAPGAAPVTLAQGTEDASFTVTSAALLAGVGDIDTPLALLSITNVMIESGGGTLVPNGLGSWTYTPPADFNGTVAFNYTVSDGTKTASSTASLHVAAVNDAATIEGNANGNVAEDTSTTTSGALTVHDVDSGEDHFQAVSGAALVGTYGNFTFNANTGTWTYALDHTRADSLTAGQLVHDKLTVTSADGTASQVIDVAVVGSAETPGSGVTTLTFDDLPAVSGSGSVVPDGYGGLDWSNFYYLNSTTSYPVSGYTHGTVSAPNVAYNSFAQTATVSGATFDFIGADLTGAWNNGLSITVTGFNHGVLVDQETVVVDTNNPTWFEFDFNGITDLVFSSSGGVDAGYGGAGAHFAMDNFEYSISVNNAATIAGDAAGSLVEDDTSTYASGHVIAHDVESGTLTVHDVDSGESHFRAVAPATLAGHYGNFTFNENTGAWTYTLVHAQADSLTAGQLVHDTLTVTSVDGTASQAIDVAIAGSNDAPVAVADTGVSITQNGGVDVSFSPILSAHATGAGSEYVITQAVNNQAGALWSDSKVSLNTSFTISAELFFGANDSGADGFSFIIQNQSKTVIGASGGGLGYQGIANSVAIEFDTYDNGAGSNDIQHDHAAFDVNGSMSGLGKPIDLGNIEDNQYHPVTIDWNAATHVITLSYDGHVIGHQTIDVAGVVGSGEAYIGFAGSTGAANNLQMVRDLTYQSADDSVVLDVLVNDTDIDAGDKTTLHVVSAASAASAKGASVTFSRLPGAGIVYSPGGAFDYLAAGQTTIDTVTYTIQDSHSASSMTTALVTIHGLNDAPVFAGEGSVGYIPGDAAVTVISGDVTASDVDSDNYDGGSFTAIVTAGGHEGDTLTVAHNEFISVVSVASGHVVMFDADGRGDAFNAVAIGDLQNNYGNANSVTVNLNGNATDAAVDALAQAIQFGNGKSDAAAGARAVTFTLHDGGGTADGGHNSDYFEATVNVTPLPPQDGPSSSSGQIELNHVPVAHDDNIIAASTAFAIDGDHATLSLDNNLLLANDIDADVDATFISSVYSIQPGHGSVSQPNIGFTDYVLTSAGDLPTGESLLLDNFAYAVLDGHSVSSAATVHLTVVAALSMDGGPGATLVDTSADNILFGGMVQGPDTFVFAARSGHDTIVNFASGQDHIDLQFGAPFSSNDETSFQAWATSSNHVVQQGHDTLITFDASSSILLKNVAAVHANDFILHPAT